MSFGISGRLLTSNLSDDQTCWYARTTALGDTGVQQFDHHRTPMARLGSAGDSEQVSISLYPTHDMARQLTRHPGWFTTTLCSTRSSVFSTTRHPCLP